MSCAFYTEYNLALKRLSFHDMNLADCQSEVLFLLQNLTLQGKFLIQNLGIPGPSLWLCCFLNEKTIVPFLALCPQLHKKETEPPYFPSKSPKFNFLYKHRKLLTFRVPHPSFSYLSWAGINDVHVEEGK
jgi:hypothetical protein